MSKYSRSPLTGDLAGVNAELEKIQNAISDQLDRNPENGEANQLNGSLDVNSQRMYNLAAPQEPNDAARLKDVQASTNENPLPDASGQTGNFLRTDGTTAYWNEVTKSTVGLNNVDNTTDLNKPISTLTQTALDAKVNNSQISTYALTLLDDVDASTARTTLELGTPTFYNPSNFNIGITTTELISSTKTYVTGDIVVTDGYTTHGDGGGGHWIKTATTGSISQSPVQLVEAKLNDGLGVQWDFVGLTLKLKAVGAILDGTTDNSLVSEAVIIWADRTKGTVILDVGTYLCGKISLNSKDFNLIGVDHLNSIIKTKNNQNDHGISITGTTNLTLKNLTLDHNRANQSLGHGMRLGGSASTNFENLRIINAKDYGIGVQAGTNLKPTWINIYIENCGLDGVDIKNYNLNNDVFEIVNLTAKNYGLDSSTAVGIDVRGKYNGVNFKLYPSAGADGLRTRGANVQGPAGEPNVTNVYIESFASGGRIALDLASGSRLTNISNVIVKNMEFVIRTAAATNGGCINNVCATGIFGTDCMTFDGTGWLINNLSVENTAASSRVFDVESGASNIRVTNVNLIDNSGNASSARINSGSVNFQIDGGFVAGGSIADSGTTSTIALTYL